MNPFKSGSAQSINNRWNSAIEITFYLHYCWTIVAMNNAKEEVLLLLQVMAG